MTDTTPTVRYSIELPFTRDPEDPFELKANFIKKDAPNKDEIAHNLMQLFQRTVESSPRLSWVMSGWSSFEERMQEFPESAVLIAVCIALSKPWNLPEFQGKVEEYPPTFNPDWKRLVQCLSKLPLLFWLTYRIKERGDAFKLKLESLIAASRFSIADLAVILLGPALWRAELGEMTDFSDKTIACRLWGCILNSQSVCISERFSERDAQASVFDEKWLRFVDVVNALMPAADHDWAVVVEDISAKPIERDPPTRDTASDFINRLMRGEYGKVYTL